MEVTDSKLFVGNLAWTATEEDLKQHFGQFGNIQQVEVMRDRFTDRARGFAFVTFATAEEAINAVNNTEGREFMGRPLKVNVARPREERPAGERRSFDGPRRSGPGGPGGGGRGGFAPRRPYSGGGGGDRGGSFGGDRPKRRFDSNDRFGDDRGRSERPRRDQDGFGDSNY
ncbi:MAG: RNA-binding protein [Puniceicoccales bacterium]|nr:RNA-binding protein [Puniceicoccales bacterium]